MSFQAYLDAAEEKVGRTPQEIVDLAHAEGSGISDRHVGTAGTHCDDSPVLRLDGLAARGQGA